MGGWVYHGRGGYYYDAEHVSQEQFLDDITDELIDYMLALRKIAAYNGPEAQRIAQNILTKYGKQES